MGFLMSLKNTFAMAVLSVSITLSFIHEFSVNAHEFNAGTF